MFIAVGTEEAMKVKAVFLNGVEQISATHANTDQGWIRRYVRDNRGRLTLCPLTGNSQCEIVRGEVRVEMLPG